MESSSDSPTERDVLLNSFRELEFSNPQFKIKLENGLDTFIVIDGLPVIPEADLQKLIKFLLKKLQAVGRTEEDSVYMPLKDNMTQGFAFVDYRTATQATQAVRELNLFPLDKKHTLIVNKLTDIVQPNFQ
jgi:translation initiation factor 3 subunit B